MQQGKVDAIYQEVQKLMETKTPIIKAAEIT
jgi:hypothetical protein